MSASTAATATTKTHRRFEEGVVDRASADKTRRVRIEFLTKHPKYGKYIRRRSLITVHDEQNVSGLGDRVLISPCRPVSKTKRWVLVKVLEKGPASLEHVSK